MAIGNAADGATVMAMTRIRTGTVLCELPPDLGLPLVAGGGYHAFTRAISSPTKSRRGVHAVLQLDRSAVWTIDGQRLLPVRAGEVALIAPGQTFHGAGGIDYPNAHVWLDLDPAARGGARHGPFDAVERTAFAQALRALGTTVLRGDADLAGAAREFVACLTAPRVPRATLRAALALLLARLAVAVEGQCAAPRDALVETALARIDAQLDGGRLTVTGLSTNARLSPTVFTRRFRATTGWSPAAWVAFRRTWRAAERLRQGDESVTAVAHALGFPSSQYLATCIRRHLGVTAKKLRAGAGAADLA